MKINFGHCVGCDQPIRPPYLSFAVEIAHEPDGNSRSGWSDVDVCDPCAARLTISELHTLLSTDEEQSA